MSYQISEKIILRKFIKLVSFLHTYMKGENLGLSPRGVQQRNFCFFSKSSSKVLDFLHTAMGENSYEEGTWQHIERRKGCYGKQCMIRKFSETSNSFLDFYL